MRKSVFYQDLYRYYGKEGEPLLRWIFRDPEIRYLRRFRKASETGGILRLYHELHRRRLSYRTGIQISCRCRIGPGLYIGHMGRIIIHRDARLGSNINVATGVIIGQENRGMRKGVPCIGDRCWIGANAVIVGNIVIGEDVLIAPLTFVNFDVPSHSVVLGNPGRILPRENATEGYIQNMV